MRILLDTNILVHAHNRASPHQHRAAEVLRRALRRDIEASVSPQVIYEFYAVITDPRRVENPLSAQEAADICLDIWESRELEKVNPTPMAPREVFALATELGLNGGAIFDCVLAVTAKENGVEAVYTENTGDFEGYSFLKVFNPLTDATSR